MSGLAKSAGEPSPLFARWCRIDTGPGTDDETITERWCSLFDEDREFWREVDDARQPVRSDQAVDLLGVAVHALSDVADGIPDPGISARAALNIIERKQGGDSRWVLVPASSPDPGAKQADTGPRAVTLEIVERGHEVRDDVPASTIIVPSEVRINGVPVLASADEPIRVHQMDFPNREAAMVTLTLFVRKLTVAAEGDL